MNIKTVNIEDLTTDRGNVREHDEGSITAIKNSIETFGQQKPIVARADGTVIAGNGTLVAMRMLGFKKVVIAETELEAQEATAYAIADNKTAELADWDNDALVQALEQLSGELPYMAGFTAGDIEALAPDLSILDDFDTLEAMDKEDGVRKSIHITVSQAAYEAANKRASEMRSEGYYIGGALMAQLEGLYGA
jgi:site-specific DNA-methyltransferase (adenine-specific)